MSTFPTLSRDVEWLISEEMEDSTIESPFESGYVHTRPRFTSDRKKWNNVLYTHLTASDKVLLTNFMTEVRMSAIAFNWVNPDDNINYVVRFKPPPKITYEITSHFYQAEMGFAEVGGASMLAVASETKNIVAGESLLAGNFVNIYLDGSTLKIKKADSVLGLEADGFVLNNCDLGRSTPVYFIGKINSALTGLTLGGIYYLSTSGTIIGTAPTDGSTVQRVGGALSSSELLFHPGEPF